jgi:predicted O-methyltransferase YrrM
LCPSDPGEPGGGQRWSVNSIEARILSELLRCLDVLEIGTGLGISTNKISDTAREVYTVDIDPWVEKNIALTLADNVHFFRDIDEVPKGLDAAFVDGKHTYEQCIRDIKNARIIVKAGGLIVLHDAKVKEVHRAIVDSGLECTLIDTVAGLAIGWNE